MYSWCISKIGQSFPPTGSANLRRDINVNGSIDSGDVFIAQKQNPSAIAPSADRQNKSEITSPSPSPSWKHHRVDFKPTGGVVNQYFTHIFRSLNRRSSTAIPALSDESSSKHAISDVQVPNETFPMRKKIDSLSDISSPRVLVGFALCGIAACFAMLSLAAAPPGESRLSTDSVPVDKHAADLGRRNI